MISSTNEISVPEVSCYSREVIEGGWVIRYMIRRPGETTWQPVKVFRADDRKGGSDGDAPEIES